MTTGRKTGLAVLGIVLLFLLTSAYVGLEFYNGNRDAIQRMTRLSLPVLTTPSWIPQNFRLGLDLKGGTHLVYDTDLSKIPQKDRAASVEGVRDVIERRVNAFGVSEPVVQTVKVGDSYRVIVELAGIHDVSQAIKLIGDTPLLEFKEENPEGAKQRDLTPEEKKALEDFNAAAAAKARSVFDRAKKGEDFSNLAKDFSDDAASKDQAGDIGWVSKGSGRDQLISAVEKLKAGEIAGPVTDPEGIQILKFLGTRNTEKEVNAYHVLICYKGAARCEKETSKEDAKKKIDELQKKVNPENFIQLAKENSTEPGAQASGGSLGWVKRGAMVKPFDDALFALATGSISQSVETEFGYHLIYRKEDRPLAEYQMARILFKTKTREEVLPPPDPWKETGLTGKQLKRAQVTFDEQTRLPEVTLEFNDEGKKLFAELTTRNIGKPVAIFLDGQPIQIPRVNEAITDGTAVISGNYALDEAKTLAQRLNTGALPVPIVLASQQTVGPTLGIESLQKSLKAGLIGFALVGLFMFFFYRLPGLVAVCALVVYTILSLALFKVSSITLSLAGIAGFILSIGMAVDANVLIFERMKEELRWGKTLEGAIANGFKRAWTSIRDSNASSLITCLILFWFSASLIKGFALTLALGILVSMFSAIVITRIALRFVASGFLKRNAWLFCAPKPVDAAKASKS